MEVFLVLTPEEIEKKDKKKAKKALKKEKQIAKVWYLTVISRQYVDTPNANRKRTC